MATSLLNAAMLVHPAPCADISPLSLPTFAPRTEECAECNGTGRRYAEYYDRGTECHDCGGQGTWEATCGECDKEKPLNDEGLCAGCAALYWQETDAAKSLLRKIDAFEHYSDQFIGWCPEAARGFAEAAQAAESELDDLRRKSVNAVADDLSKDRKSEGWLDAWAEADDDAPSLEDVIRQARRTRAGDAYLERFES